MLELKPLLTLPPSPFPPLAAVPASSAAVKSAPSTQAGSSPPPAGVQAPKWVLVWRSKGLSERDLNVPQGANTNATGSMGLKKGAWKDSIDHRHYFRDDVFSSLKWQQDPKTPTREVATGLFEIWVDGKLMGETDLILSHNTNTASISYEQLNEMTHLRWGDAKSWISNPALLGHIMELDRAEVPSGSVPKFRIRIDPAD
jgi:hypothetical protein